MANAKYINNIKVVIRIIIRTIALLHIIFTYSFSQVGGYCDKVSYFPGEDIKIYISNDLPTYNLKIFNTLTPEKPIFTFFLPGLIQSVPESSYYYGCNWNATTSFQLPSILSSGIYIGEFETQQGKRRFIFIVKSKEKAKDILFVVSTNTYQLYNNFGGKSGYDFNSKKSALSYKLSFLRPYGGLGDGLFTSAPYEENINWYTPKTFYEYNLMLWFSKNGYAVDYITDTDFDSTQNILNDYKILTVAGHSEYWSKNMFDKTEKFLTAGGSFLNLSGNTCWIQVRFENNHSTIVCYKDKMLDPMTGINDSIVTTNWGGPPVNRTGSRITGAYWSEGGVVNYKDIVSDILPARNGYGGYVVTNPDHWIYHGTGVRASDIIGAKDAIVGYETDGFNIIRWNNGFPVGAPLYQFQGQPSNFTILGWHPAANWDGSHRGYATMGLFKRENGGFVFNGATTNWTHGLLNDTVISRITKNITNKMLTQKFPPEIIEFSPAFSTKSKILGDSIIIRSSEIKLAIVDSIEFQIKASDFKNVPIKYFWKMNDSIVSFTNKLKLFGKNYSHNSALSLRGFAYNNNDTSSVPLRIVVKSIEIIGAPDSLVLVKSNFQFKFDVVLHRENNYSVVIKKKPLWAHYNALERTIFGIPLNSDIGIHSLKFQIEDDLGETEDVEFKIRVYDTVTQIDQGKIIPSIFSIGAYPNPFNNSFNLELNLDTDGDTKIEFYNILGKSLYQESTFLNKGQYIYNYNYKKFNFLDGASGVIFARVSHSNSKEGIQVKNVKLIYLK